jgi:hypothetical protein
MNNKPVLWTDGDGNYYHQNIGYYTIPLYTLTAKTLTDEEIEEVFNNTFKVRDFEDDFLKFARAILKKASEK